MEQRDRPELRGKPVIVGSPPDQRGVVCAASYEARKYGVRSAMPSRTAAKLCPDGIFIRPRISAYQAESQAIFQVVQSTGVRIEKVSVDEAYLEATEVVALLPGGSTSLESALSFACGLKGNIQSTRGLTASIGIASNKLLAKLGSDYQKPDGLTLIRDEEKIAFLRPLPCRALHGVGTVTAEILAKAGLRTVGDLQDYPGNLQHLVGSFGSILKRFAFGEDDRALEFSDEVKSISSETTFPTDTEDRPILRQCLREQADEIAKKLGRKRLGARTVQVKVRYSNFTTLTRQLSLEDPVTEAKDLFRLACWLLARERLVHKPLRLLGLGVSGLLEVRSVQLTLPLSTGHRVTP